MNDQQPYAPTEPSLATPPPLPPARRRPWIPAVAGAVAASVVWGAALALTGGSGGSGGAPGPSGYRAGANLCEQETTKALERLYTLKSPESSVLRHANMDRAECHRDLEGKGPDGAGGMMLNTSLSLHRKADPGPAFVAEAEGADYLPKSKTTVKKVSGLGERAYLVRTDMEYARFTTLSVLDGGAVYVAKVTSSAGKGDADKVADALVEDARATLPVLKRS
ncbi:hypothetical protein [Streptomyces huiliensis]|uniref:hypothetical protein n=1 Tax=Streptomyces huiliensis TaxID=2876027 RepID=UPI001CBA96DF|nr:hypothetical protein [Streptomyces huiliensis]MBZ4317923.1 hypothetical protein [Streptomyces huiliensis]